ncbi:MAG: XTP/dITP diphosphatase [Leptospirales bacterium]|nr:XTP/dITP diphosphatase [Leptospirales bacterium]
MKLVLATKNRDKIKEIKNKLSVIDSIELLSLEDFGDAPDVIEDGMSFQENAAKKAQAISAFTGLSALADDSGLCVDALDGSPGVFSARYAGENATDAERNIKLLNEMNGKADRSAKFVCAIACCLSDGTLLSVTGECQGLIAERPSGTMGFGYDPVFFLPEYGCTMAEILLEEKNKISHRASALEKAAALLVEIIRHKKP